MTNATRTSTIFLGCALAVLGTSVMAMASDDVILVGQLVAVSPSRVRSGNLTIAALIRETLARSETFRRLVTTIEASDGIVYVRDGTCGHGVPACLVLSVTKAGPNRLLRVLVDAKKTGWDLAGLIGHELQHAIEVLSDPSVTNDSAVYFFYKQANPFGDHRFETDAAIQTGLRVRAEVRRAGQ